MKRDVRRDIYNEKEGEKEIQRDIRRDRERERGEGGGYVCAGVEGTPSLFQWLSGRAGVRGWLNP